MSNSDRQVTPIQPVENTNPPIKLNMTFSEADLPTAVITEDEDSQMNVFQYFVAQLCKKCLITQELLMKRVHIVEDALQYYKDETLLSSKRFVQFDKERGDNLNGLTREFFSTFLANFREVR